MPCVRMRPLSEANQTTTRNAAAKLCQRLSAWTDRCDPPSRISHWPLHADRISLLQHRGLEAEPSGPPDSSWGEVCTQAFSAKRRLSPLGWLASGQPRAEAWSKYVLISGMIINCHKRRLPAHAWLPVNMSKGLQPILRQSYVSSQTTDMDIRWDPSFEYC